MDSRWRIERMKPVLGISFFGDVDAVARGRGLCIGKIEQLVAISNYANLTIFAFEMKDACSSPFWVIA